MVCGDVFCWKIFMVKVFIKYKKYCLWLIIMIFGKSKDEEKNLLEVWGVREWKFCIKDIYIVLYYVWLFLYCFKRN